MLIRLSDSIHAIEAGYWDSLWPDDCPFLRHAFLAALEDSGCTTEASGWQPRHLQVLDGERLIAVMPLFEKHHSWGEYVFDWAWAEAWQRCGIDYYPKLVSAIPFTPASGARVAVSESVDAHEVRQHIVDFMVRHCRTHQISGWHVLFPAQTEAQGWQQADMLLRSACQFHWVNQGYRDFDDFLSGFTSRRRKETRRERRLVQQAGVSLTRTLGSELQERDWDEFYRLYHLTYLKRSGTGGYLNRDFFTRLAESLSEQLTLVNCWLDGHRIAAALLFHDTERLYGRYWGSLADVPGLHFEACYYQGIELAIERQLSLFDPGAQGEHKIQRGFEPVTTWSAHWLADAQLSLAVADFLQRERPAIEAYRQQCCSHLPFRQSD